MFNTSQPKLGQENPSEQSLNKNNRASSSQLARTSSTSPHSKWPLPPNLLSTLKKAFNMAAAEFSHILQTLKPDLLISDVFQYWAPEVALSQNIPSVVYITSGAVTFCYFYYLQNNPHSPFPFPEIYVTDFEKAKNESASKVNALLEFKLENN